MTIKKVSDLSLTHTPLHPNSDHPTTPRIRRQQNNATENNPVPRKYREIMIADKTYQATHGDKCAEERGYKADREHDEDCQEEGKLGGGFARQAEKQAADNGRAGTRGTRNQYQALRAADFQRMFIVLPIVKTNLSNN